MPGGAPQLAVGRRAEAYLLLSPDDLADGLVLERAQLARLEAPGCLVGASLHQLGRPQEAADMIGAIRG